MSIKHIINSNTESIYVTDTYNTITNEFSHTRFSVWSNVAKFINSFPYVSSYVTYVTCVT